MHNIILCILILFLIAVSTTKNQRPFNQTVRVQIAGAKISEIPAPAGFHRLPVEKESFTFWLRELPLKKDRSVYLYNGQLKNNQSVQYAVVNKSIGHKNLQQCADIIMRLRAEYLFETGKTDQISFTGTDNTHFSFQNWLNGERYVLTGRHISVHQTGIRMKPDSNELHRFLEFVYSYCGTSSLDRQLTAVGNYRALKAGDVLIQPGFPGHAMIIADVCINRDGKKAFLLLQGYMPAQDIHLVKNPFDEGLNPWYTLDSPMIITPEWKFTRGQLKSWN